MSKGEQTLHNIHLPVSQFHIQNAIAWDLSNTPKNPDPRGVRHLSMRRAEPPPLWDPKPAHMCRYRYYSAHKTPQFHLKVVSRWNTLAASKLGSGLCRQHRPGRPSAHHIPLRWGMAANLLLLHKPVPVIKTLNGSPLKGSGLFWSRVVFFFFQGDLIREKKKIVERSEVCVQRK